MKKSIYLDSDILTITTKKLEQAGIQYEVETKVNGGNLYIESQHVRRCSDLIQEARNEQKRVIALLHGLSCEVVNKNNCDLAIIPYENIIGDLAVVPVKKEGDIVNQEFCWDTYKSPDEVMKEAKERLRNEKYAIEKMDALLRKIMENQGFDKDYIDETINMYGKGCPIWVLNNYPNLNGAAALCADWLMKIIYANLEDNFYILVPTKHEAIIIPDSDATSLAALNEMLQEVIKAELKPEDVLCNQIFYYDGFVLGEAPEKENDAIKSTSDIRNYTDIFSIFMRLREVK